MCSSYVVFEQAQHHWVKHFIDKEIGHCYIIEPYNGNWLVINKNHVELEIFMLDDISDIIRGKRALEVTRSGRKPRLMIDTCVGFVKQYLGISNPLIITPKQLYKHLRHKHD